MLFYKSCFSCISVLRKYKGKLSFLPVTEYTPKSSNNNTTKTYNIPPGARRASFNSVDDKETKRSSKNFVHSKSVPSHLFTDSSDENNGQDENEAGLTDISEPLASGDFAKLDNETSTDDEIIDDKGDSNANIKSSETNGTTKKTVRTAQDLFESSHIDGKCKSSLLPDITEPVPSDWVILDEEFITVCATYQTHLGSDLVMAPDAHFNDGIIHICFIRNGITKPELINLMGLLEKGTHIDHPSPNVEIIKCLAFRIEPESSDGHIMVDGEKVETAPIQGQVLPGLANLMAIQ